MIYSRVDLYRPSSSHLQKQKLYIWSGQRLTSFPKQALVFTCVQYKSFEITAGKGEIARHEQFLPFPQRFLPFWRPLPFSLNSRLSSANSFSLDESKISRLGKV